MIGRPNIIGPALAALVLFLAGLATGWGLYHTKPAPPAREHAAPAVRQADGSTVLERRESTPVPGPSPVKIPKGAVEERRAHLEIQPPRGVVVHDQPAGAVTRSDALSLDHAADAGKMIDSCDCPPVTVDLSLVRDKDGRRIVARSNGQILSGYDLPIETPVPVVRVPRWTAAAVAVVDSNGIRPGAMLSRRFGPFTLGAGAVVSRSLNNPAGIVSAGVTW